MPSNNLWGFRSLRDLEDHYTRHCEAEKGYSQVPVFDSVDAYGQAALNFKDAPPCDEIKECQRVHLDNRCIRYHSVTQEYIILSPDRTIIIAYYFKNLDPRLFRDNLTAFYRDCQRVR
jgi:hypothetical protein